MRHNVAAVYENGVLRPLEPLPLKEHQRVAVTVSDPAERWLDQEYMEKVKKDVAAMGLAPSLEEIRKALSKIPGNVSDDIRAEREGRASILADTSTGPAHAVGLRPGQIVEQKEGRNTGSSLAGRRRKMRTSRARLCNVRAGHGRQADAPETWSPAGADGRSRGAIDSIPGAKGDD